MTEHCNLKWDSGYYYCYYFRQALPIQLQNTSASPCQGGAGLASEKLLCPSAGTDAQNRIETEQKQATTNTWKDSMLVLFEDGMRTGYEHYLGLPSLAQSVTSVSLSFLGNVCLQLPLPF